MARKGINILASFDLEAFSKSSQNLVRSLKRTERKMKNIGTSLSTYVTAPITLLGAVSLKTFDEQQKALAQVEAGITSTGNAAGYTLKQFEKMAESMQMNSLFGDEEILKGATAQLLTFTNIAGEQFERTQQMALDLATRLDGDLQSSSIMLGKALNDPVANLSALSRAGIQFSTEQKEVVKSLVETNRLADAQNIILEELEKQYGGSAAAAAAAGLGPLKQLQMAIADLSEEFGAIIAEFILPFVDRLRSVVQRIKETTPATKKMIVIIGGLAAAIGPLIFAIGSLTAALAFLAANPVVLAITGIIVAIGALAAAIYYVRSNAEAFAEYFSNLWIKIKNNVISAIQAIIKAHSGFLRVFGIDLTSSLIGQLESMKGVVKENTKEFDTLGETVDKIKGKLTTGLGLDVGLDSPSGGGNPLSKFLKDRSFLGDLKAKKFEVNIPVKLDLDMSAIPSAIEQIDMGVSELGQRMMQLGQDINSSLQQFATQTAIFLGESIGNALTGDLTSKDFGKQALAMVGGFMKQMGALMIGYATQMALFTTSIGNPLLWPVALAAGIAMVAAGAAISNLANKGLDAGASGGGSVSTPSAPSFGGFKNQDDLITSEITLSGRDMIITQRRERSFTR